MSAAATSWILSEGYAGLQAQALGLAEAAGLQPEMRVLAPRAPWKWIAASLWPSPLAAVRDAVRAPLPELVIGCGGVAAAVGAALRRGDRPVVQVQNPRMDLRRFDLIVVNRHDELTGPNVIVTRTALHRVTPARLAAAADAWRPRLRASEAAVGRGAGRRQQRPVPPGCRRRGGTGRSARGDDAQRRRRPRGHPLAPDRSGGDACAGRDADAARRTCLGRQRRQPLFRHARAGRCDRRHDGQRVHDLRGGGHRGTGDACAAAGSVPPQRPVHRGVAAGWPCPRVRRQAGTVAGDAARRHGGSRGGDVPPAWSAASRAPC